MPKKKADKAKLRFDEKLVLNQWMWSLFEVNQFDDIAEKLNDPNYEGYDENNVSHFYHILTEGRLFDRDELSKDILLQYDENIYRHTSQINQSRKQTISWKYFQYLSLLFTEIYLDRYFTSTEKLAEDLNEHLVKFNQNAGKADQLPEFELEDLNKLAFWNATGSGKTLITHVNILQYLHYLKKNHRENELNRIMLLTPNEGLSLQHLEEFKLSGISAELFKKEVSPMFAGQAVEIIDIHKLREETGEKTIAVEAFEGNNLVLVDEGHRGSSGAEIGQWMERREKLCEHGFAFEYSATFGQAMKASSNKKLNQEYAKCILFDYSYKYFYKDGFGKDFRILNLADDSQESRRKLYMTACLLAFYQQVILYRDKKSEFKPYLVEHPLWIFVGGSVNAVRNEKKRKVSDVVDILLFLSDFIRNNSNESIDYLDRLLGGKPGLLDEQGRDIFAGSYTYLVSQGYTSQKAFDSVLATVFNSQVKGNLHINYLKGAEGELSLTIGDNDAFGVINVGDARNLFKLCEEQKELVVNEQEFSGSLFGNINEKDSQIHILIGSKKFTEGWNSWRVSTMGLMNVGRSEGSEIIQLFGRGVRLKGFNYCLKRSNESRVISGVAPPKHIEIAETLNIFGIRADYMRQFKEYLEDEGIKTDHDRIELTLPVLKNLGKHKLKIVDVKKGMDFKKDAPKPTLSDPEKSIIRSKVVLNWYPRIQAHQSEALRIKQDDQAALHEASLQSEHIAFMDMDRLYFQLQRFKNEKAWYNLNLPKEAMVKLLQRNDWYTLFVPEKEMEFTSFEKVFMWEEIAVSLLKKYCEKYYNNKKQEWEKEHLEVREVTPEDDNFFEQYRLILDESKEEIVTKIKELEEVIKSGELRDVEWGQFKGIIFDRHLYKPLIYASGSSIQVKPVALNEGEKDLVVDLRNHYEQNQEFFYNKEMYLLRNRSRGKGIGFFEAGNFHPDFILWLILDDIQKVCFIDPHGMRHSEGKFDPKVQFYKEIKKIEEQVNEPGLTLDSFIVSTSDFTDIDFFRVTKEEYEACHVVFQKERGYISKIFDCLVNEKANVV